MIHSIHGDVQGRWVVRSALVWAGRREQGTGAESKLVYDRKLNR